MTFVDLIIDYAKGVIKEMGRIIWPGKGEVISIFLLVCILSFILSLIIFLFDNIFRILVFMKIFS